jgi:hypothetical protein
MSPGLLLAYSPNIIVDSQLHSCQAKGGVRLHGKERNVSSPKLEAPIEYVQVALLL